MALEKKKTIILTLLMDEKSQAFFDAQRKLYFPAYANFTNAHVTLFHCLPNSEFIFKTMEENCKKTATFSVEVNDVFNINNFNAYKIISKDIISLHKNLQIQFKHFLSQKDLKPIKPHITIQNKVTDYKAKKTHEIIKENFSPFNASVLGISCWYFTKNNWEKKEDYLFSLTS